MGAETNPLTGRPFSKRYHDILEKRTKLPCWPAKKEFLQLVEDNQAVVLVGETGSGKTTQMPQFLLEKYRGKGLVGCTQPRRVAAMSVAARVAEECDVTLGEEVGYSIRFEERTSQGTVLKYMTDGMFLRECMDDPLMSRYAAIVLDEAHERTVATDLLFGLLRRVMDQRKDLRIIIMSATLQAEKFQKFFDAPLLEVSGRTFPVETFFTCAAQQDYTQAAVEVVCDIHRYEGPGDILLFLTGEDEIETACEEIRDQASSSTGEVLVLPLYSALPLRQQRKIFEPTPDGCRKVVVSTNVAETSVTIDGIVYVVDPGMVKQNMYNPRTHVSSLLVAPIAQAAARQRAGRAGRTRPGKCFRLYTEAVFDGLEPATHPEMLRSNLMQTLLTMKKVGVDDMVSFDYMDAPAPETMMRALDHLHYLGALDDEADLTPLGAQMAHLPLEPELARVLIKSVRWGVLEEALSLVAMLSVPQPFIRGQNPKAAQRAHREFHHPTGDHLTLFNVFNAYMENGQDKDWCWQNYVSDRALAQAVNVRKQLARNAQRLELANERKSQDLAKDLRCAILEGYFMQVAFVSPGGKSHWTVRDSQCVEIHPGSALQAAPEWIVYHELMLTSKAYVRMASVVWADMLLAAAPEFFHPETGMVSGAPQHALEKVRQRCARRGG